ncbi:hypothetical protein GNY16_20290 [Escherichia coli]|nr:hypothetical protein [Escherichia coli]EFI8595788.1 hypothetical protein [Escherichia coli]
MTLTVIEGGKRPTPPEDTSTRRKQLRGIEVAGRHMFHNGGASMGPRALQAVGLAFVAAIIGAFFFGVGMMVALTAATYLATMYLSKSAPSWGDLIDRRLAGYDPLDKSAYRTLQAATEDARRLEPWHFYTWLECEHSALDAADGIKKVPTERSWFLRKKL